MSNRAKEYYENLKGKKVAFLGIGVSHKELIHKFVAYGADVTLCDMREMDEFDEDIDGIGELGIAFQLGKHQYDHESLVSHLYHNLYEKYLAINVLS